MRPKTIIRCRQAPKSTIWKGHWKVKRGNSAWFMELSISRLFRLIATLIQDKNRAYSIDIIIRRK